MEEDFLKSVIGFVRANPVRAFVIICVIVFGTWYVVDQVNLYSHPHHWYAANEKLQNGGRGRNPVDVLAVRGPYVSDDACKGSIGSVPSPSGTSWECREMTDVSASAIGVQAP